MQNINLIAQNLQKKYPDLTEAELKTLIDMIFNEIANQIAEGKRVEVRDFGVFMPKIRNKKIVRDPRNNQEISTPPLLNIRYKIGKNIMMSLNDPS